MLKWKKKVLGLEHTDTLMNVSDLAGGAKVRGTLKAEGHNGWKTLHLAA